jgi:hypothetical protein
VALPSGLRTLIRYCLKCLPRYTRAKHLSCGPIAYFWSIPTWAKRNGCTLSPKPLGQDRGLAIIEAEALNRSFDEWRRSRKTLKALLIPTQKRGSQGRQVTRVLQP